jgi:hypothetical protein
MVVQIHSIVFAALLVFLSVLITFGLKGRAFADIGCLEQPEREAPQGAHWYYHYDREKNRKCWHLESTAPIAREEPPPVRPERKPTLASTINAAFSPLFKGLRDLFRTSMPHEAAAGEPRIIQSDATKPLRIEDIAQEQPDLPEEHAERRSATPLTSAQRKALFEEYLKWEELQRNLGGVGAPAASP